MDTTPWTTFQSVLNGRHCKRAFLEKPVARDLLENVLRASAHAPSTRNGQPWQVAVVTGRHKDALARRLCAEFDNGVAPRPDYEYRSARTDETIDARAREAIVGVLLAKGHGGNDRASRRAHQRDNLGFYGAPVEMIFHLPVDAMPGQFLEMGFFLQNVMLSLVACGLGSCPQFSVAGYPDAIRAELALGADRLVVCGLAVGYPDISVPVNDFWPERAGLAEYAQWHDEAPPDGTVGS
ncbi:nitroreductase [Actinophytocola sp.]|uniref:nitroreductase n=1 Tax=Actinophytocola sp. TaxID=1872138 RepID=UPI002ED1F93A